MFSRKWPAGAVLPLLLLAAQSATLPRPSPELTVNQVAGKTLQLSTYKGKVVVVEFLFLGSQHCWRVARTLDKLHAELGTRGFQPIAVAFGPNASEANVYSFRQSMNLTFPLGYVSAEEADRYLAREKTEILNIPQVVVIDRKGMIRAQSGGRGGDPKLEDEVALRSLLLSLLAEPAGR